MASGMSQSMARAIENAIYNAASFVVAAPHLALLTTASTATAFGTEVTGGSYARQPISAAAPSGNSIATDAAIAFTNMPACTVAGVSVVDAASGAPTMWLFIDGLSRTVAAGENLTINLGDLTTALT